jgi:hypothetical protein
MKKHDIEIEIRADGQVQVHVKGVKGKSCMSYVEFFKQLVGEVKEQKLTHEYYEPEEAHLLGHEAQQAKVRSKK